MAFPFCWQLTGDCRPQDRAWQHGQLGAPLKVFGGDADITPVSSALRRGGGAFLTGLFVALLAGAPAWAAPRAASTARSCSATNAQIALTGTDAAGATLEITLLVAEGQVLATGDAPSGLSPPRPGAAYLSFQLLPLANTTVGLKIPPSAATLETSGAVVSPVLSPDTGSNAIWAFAVPATMTTATLSIGPATVTTPDNGRSYSTGPIAIDLRCTAAASSALPAPPRRGTGHGKGGALPLAVGLAALAAAGGTAGVVNMRKRRIFARAHAEGRLRFLATPLVTAPTERSAPSVVVKILGWLEIAGTARPIGRVPGPVKELAVYLVLNRGRSFTSLELADQIWCIGRKPVTAHTIRTYVHAFRKTFGAAVLRTEGFTYVLNDSVGCDWDDYRTAVSEPDQPAGTLRGLALVRAPVLQGCFSKAKNSPFAWAERTASDIEVELTHRAHQTTEQLLPDAPDDADAACGAGLRAQPTNLALRLVDLEVGLRLGGQAELARRLAAGLLALAEFPSDQARLEQRARELGLEDVVRG